MEIFALPLYPLTLSKIFLRIDIKALNSQAHIASAEN